MASTTDSFTRTIKRILRDIQVELTDEFDRNFEREAFFSEAWERRRSPVRANGHLLVDSGALRRSVRSEIKESSIVFKSDLPYASIHNDGGEIVVTDRMKRYFRYRFYQSQGGFARKKSGTPVRKLTDGGFYAWTEKMSLTAESEFWRFMALKKVGSTIKIPRRQFLGKSPEVEQAVREIIEENITEYFNIDFEIIEK